MRLPLFYLKLFNFLYLKQFFLYFFRAVAEVDEDGQLAIVKLLHDFNCQENILNILCRTFIDSILRYALTIILFLTVIIVVFLNLEDFRLICKIIFYMALYYFLQRYITVQRL